MNKKIIIGLVGEIASGKGTATKYLREKYQASSHRFSTSLRDVLGRLHMEISRKNMQDISSVLRQNFGQDLLAKVMTEDVKKDSAAVIVVDGIRRLADIEYLRKLPEFKIVYIYADLNKRFERLVKRGENEDDKNKTFEQFLKDNNGEAELEIPRVAEMADIELDNTGSLEKLHEQIDKIINA